LAKKISIKLKLITPTKTAPLKTHPKVVHPDDQIFLPGGAKKIPVYSSECLLKRAAARTVDFKEALEQLELERYRSPIP
jgi:hypothetical protein